MGLSVPASLFCYLSASLSGLWYASFLSVKYYRTSYDLRLTPYSAFND